MSFYITLLCTASAKEFPENTRSKYTTLLYRELVLQGDYEAGIAEVFIPPQKNIMDDESEILYGSPDMTEKFYGKKGLKTLEDLAKVEWPVTMDKIYLFNCVLKNGRITLNVHEKIRVKFNKGPLRAFLGFTDKVYTGGSYTGSYAESSIAYVYCDLCEYSIVGDSLVPCLRVVPLEPGDKPTFIQYNNIHYVLVNGNRFSTVEVLLSDDTGEEMQFAQGTTIIKLHLRPKK